MPIRPRQHGDVENALGLELFSRSSRGVKLSVYGETLLPKAEAFVPSATLRAFHSAAHVFCMDVSDKWLAALNVDLNVQV